MTAQNSRCELSPHTTTETLATRTSGPWSVPELKLNSVQLPQFLLCFPH